MKNHISGISDNETNYNRLCVKIFSGEPNKVEEQLNNFITTTPITIEKVLQSESANESKFGITITLFYYSENPAQFITKEYIKEELHEEFLDYLSDTYGLDINDILAFIPQTK